jgi:acetyltransferase-like isoleucine patch superfamily enzyme
VELLEMSVILKRLLSKIAMVAPGGYSLRPWLHKKRGVQIGTNVWISQYVYLDEIHPENVVIKDNVIIGLRCTIFTHFYLGGYSTAEKVGKVIIEKDVYIGPGCIILNDVTIGEGSVVAAGSVVSKNVPPGVLYGHSPCEPLARITHPLISEGRVDYKNFLFGLKKIQHDGDNH